MADFSLNNQSEAATAHLDYVVSDNGAKWK